MEIGPEYLPQKHVKTILRGFICFTKSMANQNIGFSMTAPRQLYYSPKRGNKVCINIDNRSSVIQSGWVDAGVIKKVYVKYLEDLVTV